MPFSLFTISACVVRQIKSEGIFKRFAFVWGGYALATWWQGARTHKFLLKEDLWSILTDPLCIFRGCSGSRHLSSRVIHQSSISSYTSSSKGRAEDSCSLWREYLSWRRSPTSLMTFSACGDIYTMKKKKKCCQSEGQHEERGRLQMQRHQPRKTKL